ncbi:hypothetical protein EMIT0196P_70409 [Pseudomonas chlororaphis]
MAAFITIADKWATGPLIVLPRARCLCLDWANPIHAFHRGHHHEHDVFRPGRFGHRRSGGYWPGHGPGVRHAGAESGGGRPGCRRR